jgi:beta-phosphoglucomutase-like phosphatase (HAD superfamily)
MKGEKQSRVDLLEKKIEALIRVVQQLLDENAYLKDLSVGTLETIKLMPNYEEAIEKLKEKAAGEHGEGTSFDSDGKISE